MASLLDYPEVKEILNDLLKKLFSESGRGAIIIGASTVEEHLTSYLEDVLPKQENKYKKRLLNYPGALSSFSAKIELAFAFRLISETLYYSLNSLRELRNKAAHSQSSFSLTDFRDKLDRVFDIGSSMTIHIRNQSTKALIEYKLLTINKSFDKLNLTDEEKQAEFLKISKDKKVLVGLEKQVPHWELVYGLSLICGLISYSKQRTLELLQNIKTWGELSNRENSA